LRLRYAQALAEAEAGRHERAYGVVAQVVTRDPFYYEAGVLRIALAVLLKREGMEAPRNLMQTARRHAPFGSDLEADVEALLSRLTGVPSVGGRPEPVEVSPYVGRRLAVVVGIGRFDDPRITPLRFTAQDARGLAATLKEVAGFDEVTLLVNQEATRYDIQTAVNGLAQRAAPEDLVVIYLASHGSPEGLDKAGVNYIVTYDTELKNLYPTAYKMEDLLADVRRRIPAERVVAFLDTCFSGGTFRELPSGWSSSGRSLVAEFGLSEDFLGRQLKRTGRDVKLIQDAPNRKRTRQGVGRVIIASSRQSEKSWEDEAIGHGFFTYYLIDALRQKKALTVDEIYVHLSTHVPAAVRRSKGESQHPTMVKNRDGKLELYIREPGP